MISDLNGVDWHRFLARDPLPVPSIEVLDTVRGGRVLISGAGGSIGSALAARLAALRPQALVLLDWSESRLAALHKAFAEAFPDSAALFVLGNVGDAGLLDDLFAVHEPDLVFHAAAYKHVPLLEEQPFAAVENNVFGTETLASVAAKHRAGILLLSTDKAVRPASVMGATKRIAEKIVRSAGGMVLRLGNVLASSGSVAQVFARKLAAGEPLSVTAPLARRYFLTIDEAVNLLMAAGAYEQHGIFIPDLHVQYSIADLARFMASELAPRRDVPVQFTGPRPGDKEFEEFCSRDEIAGPANDSGLRDVTSPRIDADELQRELRRLRAALDVRDLSALLASLRRLVPDYAPSAMVLNLAEHCPSATTA